MYETKVMFSCTFKEQQQLLISYVFLQIQTSIQSHAIIILPNTDGIELLVCYEDEGVYVNTYGRITKDVVLQWGEMPTSVGTLTDTTVHFLKKQFLLKFL